MSGAADPGFLLTAAEDARGELKRLVAAVPHPDLGKSLQAVADELPLAVSVDFVNIRVLGADHYLHLVAASGCVSVEIRRRALQPLAVARAREMVASGEHDRLARSLGVEWEEVEWMTAGDEEVGALAAGTRTKRRPTAAELALLRATAKELAARIREADRSGSELQRLSLRLAQRWAPPAWTVDGPSAALRPRERTILELYADGLSTSDVASVLVISPHTVRTHVKLALRRLGVHTRDEAAALVRSDRLGDVI